MNTQAKGKIRPHSANSQPKPVYAVFRILGFYPTAKAALSSFAANQQQIDELNSTLDTLPICCTYIFSLSDILFGASYFGEINQWLSIECDSPMFYSSKDAMAYGLVKQHKHRKRNDIVPRYVVMEKTADRWN